MLAANSLNIVVYCNPAAERLLGWKPAELVGRPLVDIVPQRLRTAHLDGFLRYTRTHEPRLIGRPVRVPALRKDGSEVEVELNLGAFHTGEGQEMVVGTLRDLSDRVELERQLVLARYLRATAEVAVRLGLAGEASTVEEAATVVLETLGTSLGWEFGAMWAVDRRGAELHCVEAWRAAELEASDFDEETRRTRFAAGVGLPGEVLASGEPQWVCDFGEDSRFPRSASARQCGLHGAAAFPIRVGPRVLGVLEFFSCEVMEPDDDVMDVLATVGAQLGQFLERLRAEEAARFRAAVLASGTEASIDGVLVVSPAGEILFWNRRLEEIMRLDLGLVEGAPVRPLFDAVVVTLAEPDLFRHLTDELGRHPSREARAELALVDGRTLDCYTAPLCGGDAVHYGRGWFFRDITDRKQTEERFASLARTLQASLLPPELPDIPGLEVGVCYRAVGVGMDVGGDFYDLFPVKGTSWGVAIGDVCGKGPEAAQTTALARYAIRAAAVRARRPSQVLHALNDAVVRQAPEGRFMTVVAGRIRATSAAAELVLACGGHPLPQVVRGDGSIEVAGRAGSLIGVLARLEVWDTTVSLLPGDTIVFYTDGVTEARSPRGRFFGNYGLRAALEEAPALGAQELADHIVECTVEFSGGDPRDDVAVMVLRVPSLP